MVKRLLAFVLTAALIVETPATAYAAEQTPVPVGGGVESAQDLTEEGDETDTSAQDETEIGDTGDSISDEDADDSAVDTDTGVEDPDATDKTDEAGNAADGDAADDMEGDAASGIVAVYADEGDVEPLSVIAESVKLVPGGDSVSATAYSFNDTFTVVRGDDVAGDADLADSYNLRMILDEYKLKYAPNGASEEAIDVIVLDTSNNYAKALCSSDFYYEGDGAELFPLQLRPNTQYTLNYYLSWSDSENADKNAEGTITFTTAAANMIMEPEAVADNKLPIKVQLGTANTADLKGQTVSLSAYLKENKDGAVYSKLSAGAVEFTSANNYTQTITVDVTDLDPKTEYVLALGVDGNSYLGEETVVVYDTYQFSPTGENGDEGDDPKEDDREIKVTSVEPKVTSVTINYTLSGSISSDDFVICFYKAKDAQNWTRHMYLQGHYDWPFTITGLSPATAYEYKIGFGSIWDTPADELAKSVQGDFETTADNRKVTATVEPMVTTATIDYTLSGEYDGGDRIVCFYRAKNTSAWNFHSKYANGYDDEYGYNTGESFGLYWLDPETEYEYKIGFASDSIGTPDKLEGTCAEGSFTTLADQRKLSDVRAEFVESGEGPRIKLSALFSGNIEAFGTCIYYFYREQAGTDAVSGPAWDYYTDDTANVRQYFSQYIDDIERGKTDKTYEYAIVISDDYDLSSPDTVTKEGWKVTGTVVVPAAKAPDSVTLSQTELYLNLGSDEGGYVYVSQSIKADIAPADATKELECKSSNDDVAYAYYNNGQITVCAYGVGTAKITVKSPYSDTELAKINVEVADYRIFAKDGGSVDTSTPMYRVAYSKNTQSQEEYLLYKVEASGTATPVDNYTVTSENEDIVTWNAAERKLVTGKSVGSADLVFKDGKFEARLTVDTYTAAQKFAITGLTSDSGYDAIEKDGVYTIASASSYEAVVKFSPSSKYDIIDLPKITWSSSNTSVATVSDGTITPVGIGETTITAVTDEKDSNKQVLAPASIKIKVVDPPQNPAATPVYVLANTVTKLGDVTCPDGWAWKEPETPIVTNGVKNSYAYQFDAVYTKGDKYPSETTISVYIAQVIGMSVSVDGNSDAVLEVASSTDAESDSLTLAVKTDYRGSFNAATKKNGYEDYQIEIPAVAGLTIERVKPSEPSYDENGLSSSGLQQFTIRAQKAGKYTLNPAIYVKDANGNRKQLAKAVYKLTAVDASLAESIKIRLTEEAKKNTSIKQDINGRLYIDWTPSNEMDAGDAESVQDFDVEAILKDWKDAAKSDESATAVTSESLKATKVTWKVSDTKVATVKADSADSQKAKVTVKGEGHTILTATAKDAAGHSAQLKIEIQNHAPRVSSSKVTVNTAFDYNSYYGLENAHSAAGSVEIIPVYGGDVKNVELYEGDALSSSFKIYTDYDLGDSVYVIGTKSAEVSAGRKTAELRVTTYENKTYKYPIQVTVVNKPAKITAKSVNTVNLFYMNDDPEVSFKVSGAYSGISGVKWTDQSSAVGNGFSTNWWYDYNSAAATEYWYASQENISLNGTKLSDAAIAKGEFTVKLNGYRDAYTVPMTIKWNYKKPAIITSDYNGKAIASTTIEPSAGVYGKSFYLYDKTNKRSVSYSDDYEGQRYYNDLICNNTNVEMVPNSGDYYSGGYVYYRYTGSKTNGSEALEFKLASNVWREDITVKHTIKLAKPTAVLSVSQIVINTNKPAVNSTYILLKNSGSSARLSDMKVEGKDDKSTELLDKDLLEIRNYNGSNTVYVRQNDVGIMGKEPIKAGTYSYKLTPYYTDNSGNRQALNTVVLKVKVVNKDITVKAKVKNTLDLVKGTVDTAWYNYMEITPVFSNIGTGYSVTDVKLTGEYSKYFTLNSTSSNGYRQLFISSEGAGKLKAGQSYKLTLEYTVSMPSGDVFTVTAAPITVKPKQTAPKVKVSNNNQTIYAGADDVHRSYRLETDAYKFKMYGYTYTYHPYKISSVSGSLDCNKDGRADIIVSKDSWGNDYYCDLDVRIADRDGVLTATGAKGKTYSVPVTVTLIGRDGISRDVKTTIKVTVKR